MTASLPPSESARTVDAIAEAIISRHAPEEKPYYSEARDDFFGRGNKPASPSDNPLGFGAIAAGIVTGIVLSVLTELVVGTLANAARPWWERAWIWLLARLGYQHKPLPTADSVVPVLPPERIPGVVAAITEHAVRAGIPSEQAKELATAIVKELGTGNPE